MKVWVNTELSETWRSGASRWRTTVLLNRREFYDADAGRGVLVLTAGVDVQDAPV
ncbi:MAG: terminase gpA endonuclease subunit [Oscillospiraceae bacterium]